jgi:hypothetical protein
MNAASTVTRKISSACSIEEKPSVGGFMYKFYNLGKEIIPNSKTRLTEILAYV